MPLTTFTADTTIKSSEVNANFSFMFDKSYLTHNLSLSTSVAGSALTIAVKDKDGNDASSTSPVKVGMRSSTLANGIFNIRSITSSLSMTVSSGSTLGQTSGSPARLFFYLIDNSGTLELAVSQTLFSEVGVISTTAEGGAGAADSGTIMYSTTARSNIPYRYIGFLDNTQTTAGTWASAGAVLQVGEYAIADEPQTLSYNNAAGTIFATGAPTTLPFATVAWDNNNLWSGSNTFTPKVSGVYNFDFYIHFASITTDTGFLRIQSTGSNGIDRYITINRAGGGNDNSYHMSWDQKLLAGATVTITLTQTTIASAALVANGSYNKIYIKKVANY